MLEQKLNDIILLVEQEINLIKIKIKHNKKDLNYFKSLSSNITSLSSVARSKSSLDAASFISTSSL